MPRLAGPCDRPLSWTPVDLGSLQATSIGAVWGSSATDVWVGAQPSDPSVTRFTPLMLHRDANGWTSSRVDLERALTIEDLWGTGSDDVWGVGWGTIVHWDGASWAWRGLDSWPTPPYSSAAFPDLTTVWGSCSGGVWATSTGSHYIGDLACNTGVFFFHAEGETLTHTTALQAIAELGAWYVWGQSWGSAATDLYVAGYLQAQRAGTSPDGFSPVLLHFDDEAWQSIDFTAGEPETRALAVWGRAPATSGWVDSPGSTGSMA